MTEKAKAYAELVRVHNLLGTALGVWAGTLLLGSIASFQALIAIASAVLIAAAGYAINDYFDVEIDKINKPQRPIPSGRVSPREAYRLSMAAFVAGSLIPLLIGPYTTLFAILNAVLMYYYSKDLKRKGFIGNLVVAFSTSATLFYGALAIAESRGVLGELASILPVVVLTFSLTLAREVIKGIEDFYGDRENSVKTLAVTLGPRRAARVALALLASCFPLAILSYIWTSLGTVFLSLTLLGALISTVSVVKVLRSEDPVREAARARRVTKVAMFLGITAIILDRLTSLALLRY